jgi:hypothetical protein
VSIQGTREYAAIAAHYGDRTAQRSGVPLIHHIREGLVILAGRPHGTDRAQRAFCLHPLVQADADLAASYPAIASLTDDHAVLALAMEYRNIANRTLSARVIAGADDIPLSPLAEVNAMLAADKIQNRKDFERYHKGTHARSDALDRYFRLWLERLGIDEAEYARWCATLDAGS